MGINGTSKLVGPGEHADADLGAKGRVPRPAFRENEAQGASQPEICIACGCHHGSVGKELACLRQHVRVVKGFLALRETIKNQRPIFGLTPGYKGKKP